MKVCIFVDSQDFGGIESHILQLTQGLLEFSDYDIDILFWQDYGKEHPLTQSILKLNSEAITSSYRCHVINAHGRLSFLLQYLKQQQPLLHTHGYKAGIIARSLSLILNIPVISTYHNGDPGSGKLKLYNLIDKISSRMSHNIAVNEQICATLERCQVIPNFVSTINNQCFQQEIQTRQEIAFVGRLSHEKAPDVFCEITKDMPYPVKVYGDGPMRHELREKYPNITFAGMCEMEQHWHKIRVLVIPSRYEGLPLAALEAMARGIPIIASQAGNLPQLIAHCGIGKSIEFENTQQFKTEIIQQIKLSKSQIKQQGKKLIAYINEHYSKESTMPKILNCYHQAFPSAQRSLLR